MKCFNRFQFFFKQTIFCMAFFSCISAKYQINMVQQRGDETTLRFAMSSTGFQLLPLNSNGESCTRILLQDAAYDQEKGCPGLPHVAQSIIIPDLPKMKLEIVSVQYYDIAVQTIAPPKGSFSRNINPADVPSVFGEPYKIDSWFPSQCANLGDPSLLVYTAAPKTQHPASISIGTGSQQVTVTGTDSATVCLYSKPQNIQQVKKLVGGTATFSIQVTSKDSIYVTATKFNYETYEGAILTGTSGAFTPANQYAKTSFGIRYMPDNGSNRMAQFVINAPAAKKSLKIYACLGNLVYEDSDNEIEPWSFENRLGMNAASGIYFVVLDLKYSNTTVQLHRSIAGLK